ncbi:hypothetical protein D9756_004030 [Leucocoprinus leucothites]|uniref:Las1-domain-containing protein n=1 Tax=Leucocoprinus leucothites TaxID=201217 RepID=A0A8H5D9P3_9AGAR|nr:hypothetical protein D9756_004030 [Leucoagaricus leucothites]
MRLPRRVPWVSISELDQVCAWIYTDEHDLDAKLLAINRLFAWKAITPLPHALESTLSLLVILQQDKTASPSTFSYLSRRYSYAAAIIRLVNGLVDPLQLGAYARSIASIAAQLGLPAWLVELRHAATHEDLPSLEVLREAAQQSMSWLLYNYFLPTINPANASQRETPPLRPLAPVLKQYKSVLKTITRDASLRTRYKQEVNTITRDIERWISEAKVAANIIVRELSWDMGEDLAEEHKGGNRDDNIDTKEKWALERFCDALLEKGSLVPLSKKKRVFPEDKFWPPQFSVSLWTPLLKHVQSLHADFAYILCSQIITLLFLPGAIIDTSVSIEEKISGAKPKSDPSYDMCLARWVMWALDTWSNPSPDTTETDIDSELQKDVVTVLMQNLGHRMGDPRYKDSKAAKALLQAITSENFAYNAVAEFLLLPSNQFSSKEWVEHDMATMTNRLQQLQSFTAVRFADKPSLPSLSDIPTTTSLSGSHSGVIDVDLKAQFPGGWRIVDRTHWKPCPIGVFQRA